MQQQQQQQLQCVHHVFHLLPTLTCWSPVDILDISAGHTRGLTFNSHVLMIVSRSVVREKCFAIVVLKLCELVIHCN